MNFYCITFRLDSDNKFSKRYWEDHAESRESAISLLTDYVRQNYFPDDLFPPKIIIYRMDEYLSVFK